MPIRTFGGRSLKKPAVPPVGGSIQSGRKAVTANQPSQGMPEKPQKSQGEGERDYDGWGDKYPRNN